MGLDLILNSFRSLDAIGRAKRSRKNEKLENFLTDLQRLTIVHETDHGGSYYRFSSGASSPAAAAGDEEKPAAAKQGPPPKKADTKGAKDSKEETDPALDGDKGMSDHHGQGDEHIAHHTTTKPLVNQAHPQASRDAQAEALQKARSNTPQTTQDRPQQDTRNMANQNVQQGTVVPDQRTQFYNAQQVPNQADRQAQLSQRSLNRGHAAQLDMDLAPPISDDDASSGEHTKVGE